MTERTQRTDVWTRRSLLVASSAMAIGASTKSVARATSAFEPGTLEPNFLEGGFIDAHVHVWPKPSDDYPLDTKYTVADVVPESFTPDAILKLAGTENVRRVVLIQMSFFGFDNKYMLECIRKQPNQFKGVAIIDHNAPDVEGTMTRMQEQGVRGFRLYANAQNVTQWDQNPGIDAMFKTAAKTKQAICLLSDPEVLPAIEAMATKYPRTKIVIDHFSRIGMRGQIDQEDLNKLCGLSRFNKVFVKTSAFYALGAKKAPYTDLLPMIKQLRDAFTANRLMWGSDCPYQVQVPHNYKGSFSLIGTQSPFLNEIEIKAILGRTADEVFFQD
jgi:predicted TIM-barrel fold metal-dependent hydrolase